jgi:hypothetical protein
MPTSNSLKCKILLKKILSYIVQPRLLIAHLDNAGLRSLKKLSNSRTTTVSFRPNLSLIILIPTSDGFLSFMKPELHFPLDTVDMITAELA